jgi:hypothetical protein
MQGIIRGLTVIYLALCASLAQAGDEDWADWDYLDGSLTAWQLLASNVQYHIGIIEDASWAEAWRDEGEVGVMLRYIYAVPVSPPEYPVEGPFQEQEVEVTFNCNNHTAHIRHIYFYNPQGTYLGDAFDPDSVPSTLHPGSFVALAYARVCI